MLKPVLNKQYRKDLYLSDMQILLLFMLLDNHVSQSWKTAEFRAIVHTFSYCKCSIELLFTQG